MPSTFKVNDRVRVTCKPHDGSKPFEYTGKIVKLVTTTFGGRAKKKGAKLEVAVGTKYHKQFGRRLVTVALDKLKKA